MMLPTDHPDAPKYWMHETSGLLRPVIEDYLNGYGLSQGQIGTMRAYLRQWFASPAWGPSDELYALRARIEAIASRDDIEGIIEDAMDLGIDPL